MKSTMYIEYQGNQIDENSVVATAKKIWTDNGNKATDLKKLQVYIKPEENAAYYVFNEEVAGSFQLD